MKSRLLRFSSPTRRSRGSTFGLDLQWEQLRVRPFGDEICEDLRFDRFARYVGERFTSSIDHFVIPPEASGLRIISPSGNEETTVTG
jgi:hypothetical protein